MVTVLGLNWKFVIVTVLLVGCGCEPCFEPSAESQNIKVENPAALIKRIAAMTDRFISSPFLQNVFVRWTCQQAGALPNNYFAGHLLLPCRTMKLAEISESARLRESVLKLFTRRHDRRVERAVVVGDRVAAYAVIPDNRGARFDLQIRLRHLKVSRGGEYIRRRNVRYYEDSARTGNGSISPFGRAETLIHCS